MLSKFGKRPQPLSEEELRKLVLEALSCQAYVAQVETIHARFDHQERRIDINDVLHGLRAEWMGIDNPEFNEKFWQWKYAIKTTDVDGEPLTIVVAVDTRNRSFEVVTRWSGH